jgi:hypothetical protein
MKNKTKLTNNICTNGDGAMNTLLKNDSFDAGKVAWKSAIITLIAAAVVVAAVSYWSIIFNAVGAFFVMEFNAFTQLGVFFRPALFSTCTIALGVFYWAIIYGCIVGNLQHRQAITKDEYLNVIKRLSKVTVVSYTTAVIFFLIYLSAAYGSWDAWEIKTFVIYMLMAMTTVVFFGSSKN